MQHERTGRPQLGDGTADSDAFLALDGIHTQLRHAVEDRNYTQVQNLIAQQREVFEQAGADHTEAPLHARRAHELAVWALTMVRLQRAHDQRAMCELVAFKKAHESYQRKPVRVFDCRVEG